MRPLVSVIMPVYNAEKYIRESIDSLMSQTYDNFELIIIDDCGTDHSMEIVGSYADSRIKVFHNDKNMGIAYSRNRGLENCSGKYIAILDDDDISTKERLEKQVFFLGNNDIEVVGGEAVWIDENGKIIRECLPMPDNPDYIKTSFLFQNIYNNSEVMFLRELIEKNNIRYQDDLMGMEDFKFWIECSKVGKFSNIQECVLKRRMVKDNTTSVILKNQKEKRKQVFRELQRYSLQKSGFKLTESDYNILYQYMGEERINRLLPKEDFFGWYDVLDKIVKQCRELDFACESQVIKYMKERLKDCL